MTLIGGYVQWNQNVEIIRTKRNKSKQNNNRTTERHSPSLSPSYQPLGLLLLGIAAEVHHIGGLLILAGPLLRPFLACADCSIGYIMREYEADLRPQM